MSLSVNIYTGKVYAQYKAIFSIYSAFTSLRLLFEAWTMGAERCLFTVYS